MRCAWWRVGESMQSENPIHNVIQFQIKGGIRVCFEHKHFSSAVKLIYAGMDTMAYLSLPPERITVKSSHFVKWAETYVRFPGAMQLSGQDLYAARNSALHTHSAHISKHDKDRRRSIEYADNMEPPIRISPNSSPPLLLVSIRHLMTAFFDGVDRFLIDAYNDPVKAAAIEKRFAETFHYYVADPETGDFVSYTP